MVQSVKLTNFISDEERPGGRVRVDCLHEIHFQDAVNIKKMRENTVDLVITSPPYWSIKDYGREEQLGFNDTLNEYMRKLREIFGACIRALKPNSKLCINIGDQFLRASTPPKKVYQIIPLHAMLINNLLTAFGDDIVYLGTIYWNKVTRSKTSGGGQIMGSYPFPKSGYFFINREFIALFRKLGRVKPKDKPDPILKQASRMTLPEWREFFKDTWKIPPAPQDTHMAMFPEAIPLRLIKMYSIVGNTILDPFTGSGTTNRMAGLLGRSSIGYEIGFETKDGTPWKKLLKKKIEVENQQIPFTIEEGRGKKKTRHEALLDVRNSYSYP